MGAFVDLTDKPFNQLTVKSKSYYMTGRGWYWNCVCDCGTEKVLLGYRVSNNHIKNCGGCMPKGEGRRTHGMSNSREYNCWQRIRKSCYDVNDKSYPNYGGRGIRVCKRWLVDFMNFYGDMGPRPPEYSIERKNVNGNYTPSNCCWLHKKLQAKNTTRSRKLRYKGRLMNVTDIAKEVGLSVGALCYRLNNNGGSVAAAIKTKPKPRKTTILYRGEERKTVDLVSVANVPNKLIRGRISRGWSNEKAVETPA